MVLLIKTLCWHIVITKIVYTKGSANMKPANLDRYNHNMKPNRGVSMSFLHIYWLLHELKNISGFVYSCLHNISLLLSVSMNLLTPWIWVLWAWHNCKHSIEILVPNPIGHHHHFKELLTIPARLAINKNTFMCGCQNDCKSG